MTDDPETNGQSAKELNYVILYTLIHVALHRDELNGFLPSRQEPQRKSSSLVFGDLLQKSYEQLRQYEREVRQDIFYHTNPEKIIAYRNELAGNEERLAAKTKSNGKQPIDIKILQLQRESIDELIEVIGLDSNNP